MTMKKYSVSPPFRANLREIYFGDPQGRRAEYIYLARLAEVGPSKKTFLDVSTEHVVAIVGKRGCGKSHTLGSIAEGLCAAEQETSISRISKTRAALLFDTLNIFWTTEIPLSADSPKEKVREQYALLRGWDVRPEKLDVTVWVPSGHRTADMPDSFQDFTLDTSAFSAADWGSLLNVDIMQDRMGQLINDAFEKVVNEGWESSSGRIAPRSNYTIADLMTCIREDVEIQGAYHAETMRAVLQQLMTYQRNPVFSPGGTPLGRLLEPGKLSVLLTNTLSDELRGVMAAVLIRKIHRARAEASFLSKRLRVDPRLSADDDSVRQRQASLLPPAWVLVDEAQNLIPSGRKTTCQDVLVKFVKEGRNFGLSFAFTTQQPAAIDERIMSQVDTLIVHRLAVQGDIDEIRRSMKSSEPDNVRYRESLSLAALLRSLDQGQALISNTETERSFIADIRPRISVHGGFED